MFFLTAMTNADELLAVVAPKPGKHVDDKTPPCKPPKYTGPEPYIKKPPPKPSKKKSSKEAEEKPASKKTLALSSKADPTKRPDIPMAANKKRQLQYDYDRKNRPEIPKAPPWPPKPPQPAEAKQRR